MLNKFLCALAACGLLFQNVDACTGIVSKAENGDIVYSRTMEFGANVLTFNLLYVPQGIEYTSQLANNATGAKWTTKYAHVGFNPLGINIIGDGMNEKGLAGGIFYFPGYAEYQKTTPDENTHTISNQDFISWVLGNFATVQEVRDALKTTKVAGVPYAQWKIVPPLHYIVVDKTGDRIVVEYVKGELHLYDAQLGTITNSPTYDWHTTNVRNYIGLHAINNPPVSINGDQLTQIGQGSGAVGLPGDFTPPSRFIRATFLNAVVLNGKNGQEQVQRAFRILNQFDIPKGAVYSESNGKKEYEETQWTSASDLGNLAYYFTTYSSRNIQVVNFKDLDINAKQIKTIPVQVPQSYINITPRLKP